MQMILLRVKKPILILILLANSFNTYVILHYIIKNGNNVV